MPVLHARFCLLILSSLGLLASAPVLWSETWENAASVFTRGPFPDLKPLRLQYGFGWNGITAASADLRLSKAPDNHLQIEASGHTVGLAKTLWSFDASHVGIVNEESFRPISVRETEIVRSKKTDSELNYTSEGVVSRHEELRRDSVKSKTREFKFPNVLSLDSAVLCLRSQPLQDNAVQRFVVYPSTSGYLVTVTVLGRERITIATGSYDAIKLDVQLNKIGKKRELLPHKKFKKATVWLCDDPSRLVLRIEARIFVGSVFAELQSVQFEGASP